MQGRRENEGRDRRAGLPSQVRAVLSPRCCLSGFLLAESCGGKAVTCEEWRPSKSLWMLEEE